MKKEQEMQEMRSAEELHRFEATIMLGQTAVYLVASGTLLNAIGGSDVSLSIRIIVSIFGVMLSMAFFMIAYRTGENLRGARRRAEELGEILDFKLYSSAYRAPPSRYLIGKNVTKSICVCGGILWIAVLIRLLWGLGHATQGGL